MYSYGPPHMAVQNQDDQHEHTFSNFVRIRDVIQKTCLRRWTIGKSGERVRDIRATITTWWWWWFNLQYDSLLLSQKKSDTERQVFDHAYIVLYSLMGLSSKLMTKNLPLCIDETPQSVRNTYALQTVLVILQIVDQDVRKHGTKTNLTSKESLLYTW